MTDHVSGRAVCLFLCASVLVALGTEAGAESPRYQNPIVHRRADPWVCRHIDGWYHFTASVPEYDRVEIRRARTLQGLGSAPAAMSNPWTIAGKAVRISKPEFSWEKSCCMGMLTASDAADLLDPASWVKSSLPVLRTDAAAGIYGPGHNSFTVDGNDDIIVFHARAEAVIWNQDGTPRFQPVRRYGCTPG
jgi:GH43 family beta-xylosidase